MGRKTRRSIRPQGYLTFPILDYPDPDSDAVAEVPASYANLEEVKPPKCSRRVSLGSINSVNSTRSASPCTHYFVSAEALEREMEAFEMERLLIRHSMSSQYLD